ncbi:MAG: hypothetical protein M1831_002600 [Alyxoria varia]|nr:MAG: hypothetical protein M1831_002600 [Alyxoria varia]
MAASGIPKRADTTKGPPLRILSLDGGGVRGYSMLILLQELMHRTFVEIHGRAPKRHEIPKPSDHFDLIAGTGTGGLIALMLGRLRLDLDTCKNVYVRMTRRVFETDKTIVGIPYRSTLFKASKLEEAIRDCVREHTVFDDEGNDNLANAQNLQSPASPVTPASAFRTSVDGPERSLSTVSRSSVAVPSPQRGFGAGRWGNPNASLYDVRENPPSQQCIEEADRIRLQLYSARTIHEKSLLQNLTAPFGKQVEQPVQRPIQIGQSIFIDEGNGKFNPSPQILDEACLNEWPGRDVGVFVSIGTGKRPKGTDLQQSQWWESFVGGAIGDFAEAKRRLLAKIEGCETTHQYMMREHLSKRQVNNDNYYRLNVEVGVGEFGMNEWHRLSDISTNTRMYLNRGEVQSMNHDASLKMGKIHKAKLRWDRAGNNANDSSRNSWQESLFNHPDAYNYEAPPPANPMAVELPADEGFSETRPSSMAQASPRNSPPHKLPPYPAPPHQPQYQQRPSENDKYPVAPASNRPVQSDEYPQVVEPQQQQVSPQFRPSGEHPPYNNGYNGYYIPPARPSFEQRPQESPPPLPPKTPVGGARPLGPMSRPPAGVTLPYPDTDGPPPPINMARKPEYGVR